MPKKRFTTQYSKPASTVHPSLNASATSSSGSPKTNDAPATVNSILSNLRKSEKQPKTSAVLPIQPTLPPQIRSILSQAETPVPVPRSRRPPRFDANGRLMPAGPAPPKSWLSGTQNGLKNQVAAGQTRYPNNVEQFPGLTGEGRREGKTLRDACLGAIARNWEFVSAYDKDYLVDLPTGLKITLLSYIAVYGPEEGVGFTGLRNLLTRPLGDRIETEDTATESSEANADFFRLDLSGSIGRSISFKQLNELVQEPRSETAISIIEAAATSWEDTIPRSLSPILPHLTHLSLSHPPSTVSWPRFLQFSAHVPTLTHLSLAYWPVPSMTPNSTTAVMTSTLRPEIQLGGINYYSHSLDNDFYEATKILARLAGKLYSLEYLDLTGCPGWFKALYWSCRQADGLDWATQWPKLKKLILLNGFTLREESTSDEVLRYSHLGVFHAYAARRQIGRVRKGQNWIDVQIDDLEAHRDLWKGRDDGDSQLKRSVVRLCIDRLRRSNAEEKREFPDEVDVGRVERTSVWEQ